MAWQYGRLLSETERTQWPTHLSGDAVDPSARAGDTRAPRSVIAREVAVSVDGYSRSVRGGARSCDGGLLGAGSQPRA